MAVIPFSLKDAPALIERLLPVQKLSVESYKEQMAGSGKTLTALGSYWKGRKPLILAKACVLGCLLPATEDPVKDLQIFEMLMGMDLISIQIRLGLNEKKYYTSNDLIDHIKTTLKEKEREKLLGSDGSILSPYKLLIAKAKRPEELETIHNHIWICINDHLNTEASSFPELVEQLGIMRFGHRTQIADTFCGSGQIPFEAARLGCDVYASDLNPVACMLTWGAFNIVGGTQETRQIIKQQQLELFQRVKSEIDTLGIETNSKGWRAKVFLYCVEIRCPQSGFKVPLLPTRIISKGYRVIADLKPNLQKKCYEIIIRSNVSDEELANATFGTLRTDGRGQEPYVIHTVNGREYRIKISTLRGDYRKDDGGIGNRLRQWEKSDFMPKPDDLYQERLYCIQWIRSTDNKGNEYEFCSVTDEDRERERIVNNYIGTNLADWQKRGWVPDMRIEPGYNTDQPIRERGWTYWHHLFNARQLLIAGLVNQSDSAFNKFLTVTLADQCSRLSRWNGSASKGAGGNTSNTFDNQALNTLFTYGHRGFENCLSFLQPNWKHFPMEPTVKMMIDCFTADASKQRADIFITDPPYGDAINYDEILDFFIAWLRKAPPPEFANWIWDSRRSLAIKGSGEDFRRGMVAAYKHMTDFMPDNGLQVIMFTHQSGNIWADMANIVWASGLHVTAAWYVVTETDSALRDGSYVKGTVLLVCRKRTGTIKTSRDDLAWEIQEEVETQVQDLTGLNQEAKGFYRDENVFEDADIQMAGYAAALRVLTRYAIIDGRDMTAEAIRPRIQGETTFVDDLITFAVDTANQCLVPQGIEKRHWDKLSSAERFYLKMLDMESRGAKRLDNYQNFAKAFKVRNFRSLMASQKANDARLKSAIEFDRSEMSESSELYQSVLRAVLYGIMELEKEVDSSEVLIHLTLNIPNYYGDMTQRELVIEISEYLSKHLEGLRPQEASAARVLREMVKNQRLG